MEFLITTARRVRKRNLTYLSTGRLRSLLDCLSEIKRGKVPGNFLEFGIGLGGSAICIAKKLDGERRFMGLDVFGMIPSPGENDGDEPKARYEAIRSGQSKGIGGNEYYGYAGNLKFQVGKNFEDFGLPVDGDRIQLIEGLFEETLPKLPPFKIAFAHIDCDWYDPAMLCLEFIAPRLSSGGIIVVDDYNDWLGCKKATDEFLSSHSGLHLRSTDPHGIITAR